MKIREGESISWHLLQLLAPKVPVKRMVFHEITKEAIGKALDQTRDLDMELVARSGNPSDSRPPRRVTRCRRCFGKKWPGASLPDGFNPFRCVFSCSVNGLDGLSAVAAIGI